MKVIHKPEIDYLSIDFTDEAEAETTFENGIIIRKNKKGHVIGIDITDSSQFFKQTDTMTLQEACKFLGVSEATLRRRIKGGRLKFKKPNGKDYVFKRADILKLVG
jgi:excisionase family DNA binding protein